MLGIYKNGLEYLQIIDYYMKYYICGYLIIRFNPLIQFGEFTELDRKVAFTSGMFLLTTTSIYQIANVYITKNQNVYITKNKKIKKND